MRKKIICFIIGLCVMFVVSGCNYQVVDLQYQYNYAYIQLQDGTLIQGKIESWRDYEDGDQLQVTVDGKVYLTHSYNCTLVYDPNLT